ncbi:hypothetical protein F5887DRAFT_922051 [Amanita rubescens]|nr:hypothetical protein F5887DRAFT_922051 [Amanita rubescens]
MSTPYTPSCEYVASADGTAYTRRHWETPRSLASSSFIIFNDPKRTDQLYLIRYDTRGHGRSDKPINDVFWTSNRLAEDSDAVIKKYNVVRPYVAGCGTININGTPLTGPLFADWITSVVHEYLDPLLQSTDVDAYQKGALHFLEVCAEDLPYHLRQRLLGDIVVQPRDVTKHLVTRHQDETGLLNAAQDPDLPKRKGKNCKTIVLPKADHTPWIGHPELFREAILNWINEGLCVDKVVMSASTANAVRTTVLNTNRTYNPLMSVQKSRYTRGREVGWSRYELTVHRETGSLQERAVYSPRSQISCTAKKVNIHGYHTNMSPPRCKVVKRHAQIPRSTIPNTSIIATWKTSSPPLQLSTETRLVICVREPSKNYFALYQEQTSSIQTMHSKTFIADNIQTKLEMKDDVLRAIYQLTAFRDWEGLSNDCRELKELLQSIIDIDVTNASNTSNSRVRVLDGAHNIRIDGAKITTIAGNCVRDSSSNVSVVIKQESVSAKALNLMMVDSYVWPARLVVGNDSGKTANQTLTLSRSVTLALPSLLSIATGNRSTYRIQTKYRSTTKDHVLLPSTQIRLLGSMRANFMEDLASDCRMLKELLRSIMDACETNSTIPVFLSSAGILDKARDVQINGTRFTNVAGNSASNYSSSNLFVFIEQESGALNEKRACLVRHETLSGWA